MHGWSDVAWGQIFAFDTPPLEIVVRGTVMYLFLLCLLRLVLKRQAGALGMTDLLVLVLLADAAQNGMAGDYRSVPDGLVLVTTLVFWNATLEWLGYRMPAVERFLHPPPLELVRNGRMIRRHMRQELVTTEELMTQLRQQGLEDLSQVKRACMEGDGKISVIKFGGADTRARNRVSGA